MWSGSGAQDQREWCHASLGLTYFQALGIVSAVVPICSAWLRAWGRRLPPGFWRLAVGAAPVVALNLFVSKLFCRYRDANTILIVTFVLAWLASFKAISWAFNRGALCMLDFTPAQFLAVYAAPVTPASADGQAASDPAAALKPAARSGTSSSSTAEQHGPQAGAAGTAAAVRPLRKQHGSQGRLGEDAGSGAQMLLQWASKLAYIVVIVAVLQVPLPGVLQSFAYGMALYGLLSAVMDGPAAVVIGLTGLRVSPHFDRPWRSTSVASFWSKRWDLAAGNTLRQLVYDCVCDGSLVVPPPGAPRQRLTPARQLAGTTASFAVSGAVHEMVFWYLTGRTTGGVWFAFFLVQAPLIAGERLALAALKRRGIHLPDWLRNLCTALLVVGTGQYLFWPPCIKYGVVDAAVGNTKECLEQAVAAVLGALRSLR